MRLPDAGSKVRFAFLEPPLPSDSVLAGRAGAGEMVRAFTVANDGVELGGERLEVRSRLHDRSRCPGGHGGGKAHSHGCRNIESTAEGTKRSANRSTNRGKGSSARTERPRRAARTGDGEHFVKGDEGKRN